MTKKRKFVVALAFLMFFQQLFDMYSTLSLMRVDGVHEANPFMAYLLGLGDAYFVSVKLLIATLAFVYLTALQRVDRTTVVIFSLIVALYFVVCVNNARYLFLLM